MGHDKGCVEKEPTFGPKLSEDHIDSSAQVSTVLSTSATGIKLHIVTSSTDASAKPALVKDSNVKKPTVKVRRYDVDWLRSILIIEVLLHHTAGNFSVNESSGMQSMSSYFFDYCMVWTYQWPMMVFFALSGMGSYYSLRSRSWKEYLKERSLRLIPPFLFGVFILNPVEQYLMTLCGVGNSYDSFWSFYSTYWTSLSINHGAQGVHWFLLYLYQYSWLTLPLFLYWKKKNVTSIDLSTRTRRALFYLGIAVVFPVAFWIINGIMIQFFDANASSLHITSWMFIRESRNPLLFIVVFTCGYLMGAIPEIQEAIDKYFWFWVGSGSVLSVAGVTVDALWSDGRFYPRLIMWFETFHVSFAVMAGFHRTLANYRNGFLDWLSEVAMPVYVIHIFVISSVIFCLFCLLQSFPEIIFLRFAVVFLLATFLSVATYEVVFKHINVLRFIIGLRAAPPSETYWGMLTQKLSKKTRAAVKPTEAPAPHSSKPAAL